MDNTIYYQGVAVGIDCGSHIVWFHAATAEAIEACK
jgi:hypothetical protein